MTPEQAKIIEECHAEYPFINGWAPSEANGDLIDEFLTEHGLRLDGDTVVVDGDEDEDEE